MTISYITFSGIFSSTSFSSSYFFVLPVSFAHRVCYSNAFHLSSDLCRARMQQTHISPRVSDLQKNLHQHFTFILHVPPFQNLIILPRTVHMHSLHTSRRLSQTITATHLIKTGLLSSSCQFHSQSEYRPTDPNDSHRKLV